VVPLYPNRILGHIMNIFMQLGYLFGREIGWLNFGEFHLRLFSQRNLTAGINHFTTLLVTNVNCHFYMLHPNQLGCGCEGSLNTMTWMRVTGVLLNVVLVFSVWLENGNMKFVQVSHVTS